MAILLRHKSSIYQLNDALANIGDNISNEILTRESNYGDLTALTTDQKTGLVNAINATVASADTQQSDTLKKADNLSNLSNPIVARENLDVMARMAFDDKISATKIALGTNHMVATIAERDALTGLDENDRVHVADAGDGKWAMYKPQAVDVETGLVDSWLLFADQDGLDNILSAADVRTTYVSHADTNALTDAEEVKIGHLTVTKLIDLDDLVVRDELIKDLVGNDSLTDPAAIDAIKAYVDGVSSVGGIVPAMEKPLVSGSNITLSQPPVDGVHGVGNFGNVRYTDVNGVSYDAPVVSTVDNKVFTILTETVDLWDGLEVSIQYYHYLDMRNYEETPDEEDPDTVNLEGGTVEGTATDEDGDGFMDQGVLSESE